MILTATNIYDYMTCRKKYYLNQVLGLFKKKRPDTMNIGSAIHHALFLWKTEGKDVGYEYLKNLSKEVFDIGSSFTEFNEDLFHETVSIMLGMYNGIPNSWNPAHLIEAEKEFIFKPSAVGIYGFDDEFSFSGKIDGRTKDRIIDYKTTGSLSNENDMMKSRNLQANFYFYSFKKACDIDITGFSFRYIRRPSIRQKQNESSYSFQKRVMEDYLKRPEFYYAEGAVNLDIQDGNFLCCLRDWLAEIMHSFESKMWTDNYSSCSFHGMGCAYLPYCTKQADWENYYDMLGKDHHPELSIGKEENGTE